MLISCISGNTELNKGLMVNHTLLVCFLFDLGHRCIIFF